MAKYRIAVLPGDGVGVEVMEAARIVLDAIKFDAEYVEGDIGWEFWCKEGDPLPERTTSMLKQTDACLKIIERRGLHPESGSLGGHMPTPSCWPPSCRLSATRSRRAGIGRGRGEGSTTLRR